MHPLAAAVRYLTPPLVHAAQRFDDSLKAVGIDYVKVRSE
jgi:hypothetical protein|tara:strand:- start:367 stop:486 length:120 start_codon:yes stop_codon:yes gene_type:complete